MNMREQIARAMWQAIRNEASYAEIGAAPEAQAGLRNVCVDGNFDVYAVADAALYALLQLPEKACLPLGEWGVGEEGKRAAALLTWNAFISVVRLIQKGTA